MNRTEQIARAVATVALMPPGQAGLYVEDARFDVRVVAADRGFAGMHVWDSVQINGNHCGNRHGGVRFLLEALGAGRSEP